ncbi:hypothetical protein ACFOWB_11400 [Chenggangzhangella methanolivorans]
MDDIKLSLSAQDTELVAQALDVYATTLMCTPLGLGLDLLVQVRALRSRLADTASRHVATMDALDDPDTNVVMFAARA